MSYYAVSDNTVVVVNLKAGSMAMRSSIMQTPFIEVTAKQALNYERRVMFLRDPIERVNSMFNMLYHLTTGNSSYDEILPSGVILAHGARVSNFTGINDHRYTGKIREDCAVRIYRERIKLLSDDQIISKLDNEDYERYVDYILAGNKDDHWGVQVDLSKHNSELVPNIIHNFNELADKWQDYVTAPISKDNSWPAVTHDVYRLNDLNTFYADDLAVIGSI